MANNKVSEIIASALRSTALATYANVIEKQVGAVDLTGLLFSNFDTVPAQLLPIYAELYDIARFVKTEQQTRAFLGRVIALYRKKGTPWSIRQAFDALGYPDITILEGAAGGAVIYYDGTISYDGATQYGGGAWALFSIIVHLHGAPAVSFDEDQNLRDVIEEFKPARCQLLTLTYN